MHDQQLKDQLRSLEDGPGPDPFFADRLHDLLAAELGLQSGATVGTLGRPGRHAGRVRRIAWFAVAAALVVGLTLGALLVAGALLTRKPALTYTPGSEPAACPRFAPPLMECLYLVVPEDRSDPTGRQIRVFVARLPSTAASPAADPLVFIEGPLELESTWLTTTIPNNPALAQRDLVWVGHRGTGSSVPSLACPEVDAAARTRLGSDLRSEAVTGAWSDAVTACHDRLVTSGVDLSAYGLDESAADVADARVVLGYPSWDLSTYSLPGVVQTVLRDRPAGIRAVVFDSPTPLDGDPFGDALQNLTSSLVALQAACTANPACGASHPDIAGDLARQAGIYESSPADVTQTAVDGSQVLVHIDGARRWEIARWELADQARLGLLPGEFGAAASASLNDTLAAIAVQHAIPGGVAAYGAVLSLVCRDGLPNADQDAVAAAAAGKPGDGPVVPIPAELAVCAGWKVTPARSEAQVAWTSAIPALILVGAADPLAPPADATSVARHFDSPAMIEAPGATNRLFAAPTDGCSRPIRAAFIASPNVAPDATCLLGWTIAFP